MLFNTETQLLCYKGEYYANGTEVIISDGYIENHMFLGKKLWKHAYFHHEMISDNKLKYFFCQSMTGASLFGRDSNNNLLCKEYATYFVIEASEIEDAIEGFLRPIKMTPAQIAAIRTEAEAIIRKYTMGALIRLWLGYITVMIGSLIFREYYCIWAVATIIFWQMRKEILNK